MRRETSINRIAPSVIFALALTCLLLCQALAQTSASLSGIVNDSQGKAVAGARVVAGDPSRNLEVESRTGNDGAFAFPALQPGTYTVTVEAAGFKKFVKTGVVLAVADRQSTGEITLEVGEIGDTVEVTADAAQLLVKTESGEQSQVIGLTFGLAYTWSKALGTSSANEGDYINIVCSRCYDYRVLDFDRTHTLVINYLYDLPRLRRDNWLVKGVINGWQLTGISQFLSGQPLELGFGIPNINTSQRITGSWTEGPRPILAGDAQPSLERNSALDITKVSLPNINPGPQPRSFVRRPGINVTDLSLFKNIPFGGEGARYLQLRLETFNIFNHAQFDNFNAGLTFDVNNFGEYAAKRIGSPQTIRNTRTGVSPAVGPLGRALGEYNVQPGFVSGNRILQVAVKLYFKAQQKNRA